MNVGSRFVVALRAALFLAAGAVFCQACEAESPPNGPERTCAKSCSVRAQPQCSSDACARGCNLVLDRLVQHEGDRVLECIASSRTCDDRAWARCATLIGPYADGGPPAPAPPPSDVLEDQE